MGRGSGGVGGWRGGEGGAAGSFSLSLLHQSGRLTGLASFPLTSYPRVRNWILSEFRLLKFRVSTILMEWREQSVAHNRFCVFDGIEITRSMMAKWSQDWITCARTTYPSMKCKEIQGCIAHAPPPHKGPQDHVCNGIFCSYERAWKHKLFPPDVVYNDLLIMCNSDIFVVP